MGTTDANGIYFYEDTDAVSPLHTLLNLGQTSITDALNANTRIWPVANEAAATALLASRGSSVSNPLVIWQADVKAIIIHDGTSWVGLMSDPISTTTTSNQGPGASGVDLTLVGSYIELPRGRWEITGGGSLKTTGGIADTCVIGIYNVTTSALVAGSRGTSVLVPTSGSASASAYPTVVNITSNTRYCVQMHPNGGSQILFAADAGGLSSWIRARRV